MAKKRRLFTHKLTTMQRASNELNWALILARRAGISVPAKKPKTAAEKMALAKWIYEELEKRKPIPEPPRPEPPKPPAPEEPEEPPQPPPPPTPDEPEEEDEAQKRRERGENVRAILGSGLRGKDLISAIMSALNPDEQAKLRAYSSDDIIQIAGIYAENPDLSMDECIEMYYGQQEEFFNNLDEDEVWGDYSDIF